MSTFSGLSTALSSLNAQRQALQVAGQNIANANTVGYTRQRADLQSVDATSVPVHVLDSAWRRATAWPRWASLASETTSLTRACVPRPARRRSASANATTFDRLESVVTEPSDTGLASGLQQFWTAWEDVANAPDSGATRTALIGKATALVNQVTDTYRAYQSSVGPGAHRGFDHSCRK